MNPSPFWLRSLLATALVAASLADYAPRTPHGGSILERSPIDGADDQGISSDNPYKYDRISGVSSKSGSDPDQLLINLWNERTQQMASRPWSKPLQLFNRPSDQYQVTKREGHSLSIVNPLDVLRQRMMLEMARRRMKENQEQIKANDVILKTLGKRSGDDDDDDDSECDDEDLDAVTERRAGKDQKRRRQKYPGRGQGIMPDEFAV